MDVAEPTARLPIAVFAPTTQMSVTLERTSGIDEVHVHAAGQGFWVARMLTVLGHEPLLCTPIGGETGSALRALLGGLPTEGFVPSPVANGAYVHDRREGGERQVIAHVATPSLDRHTVDDLVSATIACALRAGHVVITGTNLDGNLEPAVFQRLCRDLRGTGVGVVADLSGAELAAALEGGIDLVKISHEELIADGWSSDATQDAIVEGVHRLRAAGARDVVVSRAHEGALAAIGDDWMTFVGPGMTVIEHRGAGDSMTAVLAHGRMTGLPTTTMLRLAAAASTLNVTRHGLASGHLGAILEIAELVEVTPVES